MDHLTLDNLLCNKRPATMRLSQESVILKAGDQTTSIRKDSIKNMELFRGLKALCLRISYEDEAMMVCDVYNIHESQLVKLKSTVSQNYGLSLSVQELETLNTTEGNLVLTNDILYFQSQKQIFSIPKSSIRNVIEVENDVQLDLGDVEIALSTTSNISQLVDGKSSVEICIVNGVNCINPRSKSCLVFFSEYVVMKGSSYDHVILYDGITGLFYLKNDSSYYLVLKLENCIAQGQTKYDSIVFLLPEKELEVAANDARLKSFYSGMQCDVVLEIFESLLGIKAQESTLYFKCTSKVFDGHLYFLSQALLFLPKPISIPIEEISYVEFSRINLSIIQAKTFDMTVFASKVYNFNGIQKDAFNQIELYFNQNGVRMVSEVIEDSYSEKSSETSGESEDLSDIIASEE